MRLPILEYPDPRLRTVAQPVTAFDAGFAQLVDDLLETMYATRAIGLAATQVDVHRRVVVMDVSGDASAPQVFVNPRVLSQDTPGMVEESCLSVPGVVDSVRRATRLRVGAQDRGGAPFDRRLEGVAAVCLLHEIDHLDGRLFVDHLSYLRRLRLRWKRGRERRAVAA
jgi:peptide deformylase